jgi:hypothetical protein
MNCKDFALTRKPFNNYGYEIFPSIRLSDDFFRNLFSSDQATRIQTKKKGFEISLEAFLMVGVTGIEPVTLRV